MEPIHTYTLQSATQQSLTQVEPCNSFWGQLPNTRQSSNLFHKKPTGGDPY